MPESLVMEEDVVWDHELILQQVESDVMLDIFKNHLTHLFDH